MGLLKIGRDIVLRGLGWRERRKMINDIPGDEYRGAVTIGYIESRPWWENDRIVEEHLIDWDWEIAEEDDD